MKKFLLTAALILAVVTSLTAGTLAAYNQTLSISGTELTSKKFDFSAKGSESFDATISDMTPGKTVYYKVDVANNSEVPVDFTVTAALSGNLAKSQNGPVTVEVLDSNKAGWVPASVNNLKTGFSFYVKVNWPYSNTPAANQLDYNMAKEKEKAKLSVTVNGTYAQNATTTDAGEAVEGLKASY